jgi:hypothetical protein
MNPLKYEVRVNNFILTCIFAILGYCAVFSGNSLPTFQDDLLVPFSRHKKFLDFWISWPLKMGVIGCPETSAKIYSYRLHNNLKSVDAIYFTAEA